MEDIEMYPRPREFPLDTEPWVPPIRSQEDIRGEKLGEEIATLSAQLQVATYQLLVLLREFDELGGWAEPGLKSCAHWLSWRTGLNEGAAREKIRVAHALANLPLVTHQ